MLQGSRHIQSEYIVKPTVPRQVTTVFHSGGSVLFDVDTGRILDPSPPSILPRFPDLQLPFSYQAITSYESFDASGQIVRLSHWDSCRGDGSEYSFNSTQYEIIERHDSDPQDVGMLCNVNSNGDCDHITNSGIQSTFISIANTQASRCDNYLLPAIGGSDCPVVQYAHGLLVADKRLGLMLKIEPGTTSCRKWMTLDGGANEVDTFAVMEDGSRLLGLTGAAGKISLREWETSTGTICCERIYGRS